MVTILDVARLAGVSHGTASNVFNRPERVREALRKRVLKAAEDLGYGGPNPQARLMRTGKINAIGVTPPGAYGVEVSFRNPYQRELLGGIAEICDREGASLTLVTGIGEDKARGIREAIVDGFILHQFDDAVLLQARRRRLPFVLVDMDGDRETSSVRVDDRAGARAAADHLVALGHRRFAIFSVLRDLPGDVPLFHVPGSHDRISSRFSLDRDRLNGFLDGLATIGVGAADLPILETHADSVEGSVKGAALLFDRVPDVTAVLTMTDVQALAVIGEAQRRGIRVPEDLSVVGFDDIPEARLNRPALTTVVHPIAEKGRTAARLLFGGAVGRHVVLPVDLAVRGSTAPPPKARKGRAGKRP